MYSHGSGEELQALNGFFFELSLNTRVSYASLEI
jgi:hypothetical protein